MVKAVPNTNPIREKKTNQPGLLKRLSELPFCEASGSLSLLGSVGKKADVVDFDGSVISVFWLETCFVVAVVDGEVTGVVTGTVVGGIGRHTLSTSYFPLGHSWAQTVSLIAVHDAI